jgi:hypothetical protein
VLILPERSDLILACHFTGIHDVNRNTTLPNDDFSLVEGWAGSVVKNKLHGIIFHNNFSHATTQKYENENLRFVKVELLKSFNPNVFRYFVYLNFLQNQLKNIANLFATDISDVVVLQDPFKQQLFLANPEALFCGDEPKTLENDWMIAHSAHLRSGILDFEAYEEKFKSEVLLNCGIIGGNASLMLSFLEKLCHIHKTHNQNNKTGYTGDMGTFNYLVRTQYNHKLFHGEPVNTEFKAYQMDRRDCWFRHK